MWRAQSYPFTAAKCHVCIHLTGSHTASAWVSPKQSPRPRLHAGSLFRTRSQGAARRTGEGGRAGGATWGPARKPTDRLRSYLRAVHLAGRAPRPCWAGRPWASACHTRVACRSPEAVPTGFPRQLGVGHVAGPGAAVPPRAAEAAGTVPAEWLGEAAGRKDVSPPPRP